MSLPRVLLLDQHGHEKEWRSQTIQAYKRLTKRAEAIIANTCLAGTNTRRVRRALAGLFEGKVGNDAVSRVWRKVRTDWESWQARDLSGEGIVRLILGGASVVSIRRAQSTGLPAETGGWEHRPWYAAPAEQGWSPWDHHGFLLPPSSLWCWRPLPPVRGDLLVIARSTANAEPMAAGTALAVGMAAAAQFIRGDHRHRVVIGKHTPPLRLQPALTAGFVSMGMDVFLVGPMPTPAVAMLTRSLCCDLGVVISPSHNPYQDNGIKLFGPGSRSGQPGQRSGAPGSAPASAWST